MGKKVCCLYRVSTLKQVEKDDIPMQKQRCHEFAAQMGRDIVREFSEKGVSGFKVSAKKRDAILDAERPDTLHRARELLQEMDNYQRIVDTYSYGQQRLQERLGLDDESIAELEGYMDFERYGADCMEHDGVVETEFGRLRRLEPPFPEQVQEHRPRYDDGRHGIQTPHDPASFQ